MIEVSKSFGIKFLDKLCNISPSGHVIRLRMAHEALPVIIGVIASYFPWFVAAEPCVFRHAIRNADII